jgi:hypothetical protein
VIEVRKRGESSGTGKSICKSQPMSPHCHGRVGPVCEPSGTVPSTRPRTLTQIRMRDAAANRRGSSSDCSSSIVLAKFSSIPGSSPSADDSVSSPAGRRCSDLSGMQNPIAVAMPGLPSV